jgi:hypothetical protein
MIVATVKITFVAIPQNACKVFVKIEAGFLFLKERFLLLYFSYKYTDCFVHRARNKITDESIMRGLRTNFSHPREPALRLVTVVHQAKNCPLRQSRLV